MSIFSVLFPGRAIETVRETTLSGNRSVDDWRKKRFDWTGSSGTRNGGKSTVGVESEEAKDERGTSTSTIQLTAMDIRTFVVKVGVET
mmetsp:Transcript_7200/g.15369  ORF Transcript_7200/g.15369 Transcript_7200/m.15369 type:complete len:88 (-) Transcript_7200:207-470(-)